MRQDPDTILVGEIRDQETAEIAVRASLTGHLVFSTLHTNDAVGAVLRFLDMGTEPYLLAASLRAVLAQRLARRLCPACAIEGDLTAAERDWLVQAGTWKPQDGSQCILRAGTGCGSCIGGYRGRVGLFELLIIEQALGDLVRSGKCDATDLRASARQAGMQTLVADGSAKVLARVTDLTELRRVIGRRH